MKKIELWSENMVDLNDMELHAYLLNFSENWYPASFSKWFCIKLLLSRNRYQALAKGCRQKKSAGHWGQRREVRRMREPSRVLGGPTP